MRGEVMGGKCGVSYGKTDAELDQRTDPPPDFFSLEITSTIYALHIRVNLLFTFIVPFLLSQSPIHKHRSNCVLEHALHIRAGFLVTFNACFSFSNFHRGSSILIFVFHYQTTAPALIRCSSTTLTAVRVVAPLVHLGSDVLAARVAGVGPADEYAVAVGGAALIARTARREVGRRCRGGGLIAAGVVAPLEHLGALVLAAFAAGVVAADLAVTVVGAVPAARPARGEVRRRSRSGGPGVRARAGVAIAVGAGDESARFAVAVVGARPAAGVRGRRLRGGSRAGSRRVSGAARILDLVAVLRC